MTGSGKTTFAIRYLLNVTAACRFVFDDLGQVAARLKRPQAGTASELEAALASKWVLFNPHRMFPGDVTAAFAFFCQWSFDASRRGPGKKVFVADEVWRWCSPNAIPRELAIIAQMGRAETLELMCATQLPHKVHASITGQATELICFRLDERLALDRVAELGANPAQIQALPLGSFQALNRLSRATLAGQVF
jgi:hypothetical protein